MLRNSKWGYTVCIVSLNCPYISSVISRGPLVHKDEGLSESNKGNPAARAYIGTSAAAERGMVTWIMRLNMRVTEGQARASIYSTDFR